MEIDATMTDMEDFFIHTKANYSLDRARYYPFKQGKRQTFILPIHHLIQYNIDYILSKIRKTMGAKYFDRNLASNPTELQKKILQLTPSTLRELFSDFIHKKPVEPIDVIKVFEINDPSPLNINKPSVMGLETTTIKQTLRYVDNLYRPINGTEKIALSIFFHYDHIPIIVTL